MNNQQVLNEWLAERLGKARAEVDDWMLWAGQVMQEDSVCHLTVRDFQ